MRLIDEVLAMEFKLDMTECLSAIYGDETLARIRQGFIPTEFITKGEDSGDEKPVAVAELAFATDMLVKVQFYLETDWIYACRKRIVEKAGELALMA